MLKKILIATLISFSLFFIPQFTSNADAYYVNGYYRSNGTYVNGYYRSRANAYTYDNYSYTRPSSSNGYGYNDSYYSGNSYSNNWYKPSYYDTGWAHENYISDLNRSRY